MDANNDNPNTGETMTRNTATPTELGLALLKSILNNEYRNGDKSRGDAVGEAVWTWSACEPFGNKAGGIVARLVAQGLVGVDNYEPNPDDHGIWLTDAGYSALVAAMPELEPARETARKVAILSRRRDAIEAEAMREGWHDGYPANSPEARAAARSDRRIVALDREIERLESLAG